LNFCDSKFDIYSKDENEEINNISDPHTKQRSRKKTKANQNNANKENNVIIVPKGTFDFDIDETEIGNGNDSNVKKIQKINQKLIS
jgi:hypothetical protein